MPELNLGKVVGPQGPQGAVGPAGAQGVQGIQGVPGKDATINGYNILNLSAAGAAQLTQDNDGNVVITASGENLLDNAYFADKNSIIDQRMGYVLIPGANYYSDSTLTDKINTEPVSAYATVYNVTETANYISFKISASATETFYAAIGDVVRGYVGAVYTIDRWKCYTPGASVFLTENGLAVRQAASTQGYAQLLQRLEPTLWNEIRNSGRTVTASILLSNGVLKTKSGTIPKFGSMQFHGSSYIRMNGAYTGFDMIIIGDTCPEIVAVKFELGSTQTLAHQEKDENGNDVWVLNEIHDYRKELRKCQRYFVACIPQSDWPRIGFVDQHNIPQNEKYKHVVNIPLPVTMRANPTVSFSGSLSIAVCKSGATSAVPVESLGTVEYNGASMISCVAITSEQIESGYTTVLRPGDNSRRSRVYISADP